MGNNSEITASQAAPLAGCSGAYLRRMLVLGRVRGRKLAGGQWLVREKDAIAFGKTLQGVNNREKK